MGFKVMSTSNLNTGDILAEQSGITKSSSSLVVSVSWLVKAPMITASVKKIVSKNVRSYCNRWLNFYLLLKCCFMVAETADPSFWLLERTVMNNLLEETLQVIRHTLVGALGLGSVLTPCVAPATSFCFCSMT